MTTVIKVDHLSKSYLIGHQKRVRYLTLRDVLAHKARGMAQRIRHPLSPNKETVQLEEFWALKDINLEIQQGERVGIIGRNGAGKSTLLKILSRITEPTKGRFMLNGRVASLLEVGTGFHPELSGRENIFLNGAVLGMKKQEIKRRFDEIVAFAEVEKFLDTPVKRYSSGMYVRLAFAVAAHLESEILIVDEVLAVGDLAFQKKCLGKMGEVGGGARTVLFVSHNMNSITSLCERCLLLEDGDIIRYGDTKDVIETYLDRDYCLLKSDVETSDYRRPVNHGIKVKIKRVKLHHNEKVAKLSLGSPFEIEIFVDVYTRVENISVGLSIISFDEINIIGSTSAIDHGIYHFLEVGTYKIKARMAPFILAPGKYNIHIDVRNEYERLDYLYACLPFEVVETRKIESLWFRNKEGFFKSEFEWKFNKNTR